MSIPSQSRNLDGEHLMTLPAACRQIASKQFTVRHDVGATLSSGVSGMKRKQLRVRCESDDDLIVFIGGTGVSYQDGFPMYPGDELELDVSENATVKAIGDNQTGEATVYILELE